MSKNIKTTYSEFSLSSLHADKPIMCDITYVNDGKPKPVILFTHGFKSFKDWGCFPLVSQYFAMRGYVFVKISLSHNGTTPDHPQEFVDLEAFGNNNFSIELDDMSVLIDHIFSKPLALPIEEMNFDHFFLLGHSRGGGLSILKAGEENRVKGLAAWAPIGDIEMGWSTEVIAQWKAAGVYYIHNSRTNQEMPLYYQIAEDYFANKDRLDIPKAIQSLSIPVIVFHGSEDQTVPEKVAQMLKAKNSQIKLTIIDDGDHTFGATHPYESDVLPDHLQKLCIDTDYFFKQHL